MCLSTSVAASARSCLVRSSDCLGLFTTPCSMPHINMHHVGEVAPAREARLPLKRGIPSIRYPIAVSKLLSAACRGGGGGGQGIALKKFCDPRLYTRTPIARCSGLAFACGMLLRADWMHPKATSQTRHLIARCTTPGAPPQHGLAAPESNPGVLNDKTLKGCGKERGFQTCSAKRTWSAPKPMSTSACSGSESDSDSNGIPASPKF